MFEANGCQRHGLFALVLFSPASLNVLVIILKLSSIRVWVLHFDGMEGGGGSLP